MLSSLHARGLPCAQARHREKQREKQRDVEAAVAALQQQFQAVTVEAADVRRQNAVRLPQRQTNQPQNLRVIPQPTQVLVKVLQMRDKHVSLLQESSQTAASTSQPSPAANDPRAPSTDEIRALDVHAAACVYRDFVQAMATLLVDVEIATPSAAASQVRCLLRIPHHHSVSTAERGCCRCGWTRWRGRCWTSCKRWCT